MLLINYNKFSGVKYMYLLFVSVCLWLRVLVWYGWVYS